MKTNRNLCRSFLTASAMVLGLAGNACATRNPMVFDTHARLRQATRVDEVTALLGDPGGIVSLEDHTLGCEQRWAYTAPSSTGGEEVIFVDVDDQGRVCDVAWGRLREYAHTH